MYLFLSLSTVLILALAHVYNGALFPRDREKQLIFESVSAGVAVGYLFLRLLPKLAEAQPVLLSATDTGLYGFLEHHAYLVALMGFLFYFASDQAVQIAEKLDRNKRISGIHKAIIYIHASMFSGYCFLVGYLIAEIEVNSYAQLFLTGIAMTLHFIAVDYGLRHRFTDYYNNWLKWLLFAATLGGWAVAMLTEMSYVALSLLWSFFSGALLINVIKEELKHAESHTLASFLAGIIGFTLILLILEFNMKSAL